MNKNIVFIVPVFNTEKYVDKCCYSLQSQTNPNFKCILIDNGSTDNSGAIIDEFMKLDRRFYAYHLKDNEGVSTARNYGLDKIEELYSDIEQKDLLVAFVDSDDYIAPHYVDIVMEAFSNDKADYIVFGYKKFDRQGHDFAPLRKIVGRNLQSRELLIDQLLSYGQFSVGREGTHLYPDGTECVGIWNKVFNYELIKSINLHFETSLLTSEDLAFSLNVVTESMCCRIVPEYLYFYRQRQSSLMHSNVKNTYENLKNSISYLEKYLDIMPGSYVKTAILRYYLMYLREFFEQSLAFNFSPKEAFFKYKKVIESVDITAIDKSLTKSIKRLRFGYCVNRSYYFFKRLKQSVIALKNKKQKSYLFE